LSSKLKKWGQNSRDLIFKLKANYYTLLAGIFIATAIDFYSRALFFDNSLAHPGRLVLALSASLVMVSSFLFAAISVNLEGLDKLLDTAPEEFGERETAKHKLYYSKKRKISLYLAFSIITLLIGFLSLLLPY